MKLYHIIEWDRHNLATFANSAREAGEKLFKAMGGGYSSFILLDESSDTACFGLPDDADVKYYVDPVCLGDKKCIECQGGVLLTIDEDIELLAQLLIGNLDTVKKAKAT